MFYIYFIYSDNYNKYYIGFTQNIEKRLAQHNSNDNKHSFTAKLKPWRLVANFAVGDSKQDAMKVERFIKKQKSKQFNLKIIHSSKNKAFIDKLINDILLK